MKKLLVIFLLILLSNISSAQSGWGYVNYISYKTHNGTGTTNQYSQFANNAAGFDIMFNTANSNTTITHTGEVPISYLSNGSSQVPRWNNDYFGYKFEFWFVPTETGTYRFGINSDDASDLSVGGTMVTTYYGGHGASGYRIGTINVVAGTKYKVVARFQEYGGGEAFYLLWSKPSSPTAYSVFTNEVTNIESEPTKKAKINFGFNTNLDATKFSASALAIATTGLVDITNALDSNQVANGSKATIVGGGVEWSYVNPNASWLGGNSRLLIDMRKFGNTLPTDVKSVKILDVYDGPVTYSSHDPNGWAIYTVPSPLTKVTDGTSTNTQYIRNVNGWNTDYAFACDVSFGSVLEYKPQPIILTTTNNLSTLYNSIITVSDVWLAFKEVANTGIFGNESGKEFTYGIQYKNGDVNDDGYFNEADAFLLLQHLTGKKNIVDTFTLSNTLKIIPTTIYNNIGKSNWTNSPSFLGDTIILDINTGKATDTFDYAVSWKGDVNLSHSTTPASNGITTMAVRTMSSVVSNEISAYVISEIINGKIVITISLDPLQQEVVGTQFQLNYDNTLLKFEKVDFVTAGNPINYGNNKGSYINIGSLITDGSTTLNKMTEYKITFTPISELNSILGLTSISTTDAINKNGTQLKLKIN